MTSISGFRERSHTADWELEVWGSDLPALFEQAARGMYALAGVRIQAGPPTTRRLELDALDVESLLVRFLEEILYLQNMEHLAFDFFDIQVDGFVLRAELSGALMTSLDKEIKAVTYHKLSIHPTRRGLETRIVMDV
jgi:SHS2 domain-containing protein